MSSFFSKNTWLIFRRVVQKKRLRKLLIVSIFVNVSFLSSIAYFFLKITEADLKMNIVLVSFWGALALLNWILYLVFKLSNTDKTKIIFRPNNPSAEFLREYQLINDSFRNCKLTALVDGFVSKLNGFDNVNQQNLIFFAISALFIFYLDLAKLIDKNKHINFDEKKYNFANGTSEISFEKMLEIVNDYFNSLNLEIEVLRSAKNIKI